MSRYEERLLLALGARGKNALISAKNTEIRQIEPFVVRLAEAVPAESVRSERKSTGLKDIVLFQCPLKFSSIYNFISYVKGVINYEYILKSMFILWLYSQGFPLFLKVSEKTF